MAFDTFMVYVGVYTDVDGAEADYEHLRACHDNRVSRGWTKIDCCDRHGGREGHPREQQPLGVRR
jgi:hypothetical protein